MDCSLPGSSIHGIFQARALEWGAIAFSDVALGKSFNLWPISFKERDIKYILLTSVYYVWVYA